MKYNKYLGIFFLMFVGCGMIFCDDSTPSLELTFTNTENPTAVEAHLTVKNTTKELLSLDYENGEVNFFDSFHIAIVDSNGNPVGYSELGKKSFIHGEDYNRVGSVGGIDISPGDSHTFVLNVGKYFDLSRPGTYTVNIHPENLISIKKIDFPVNLTKVVKLP